MVKELVFHLGDCKTGSTSIQETLRRKNWVGGGRTVAYPARLHHAQLAAALYRDDLAGSRDQRFGSLRKKIAGLSEDIAIVSSENFEFVDATKLKDVISDHFPEYASSVRLISYVRPHAERVLSSYSELVKTGQVSGSLEEFVSRIKVRGRFQYFDRFNRLRDAFGDRFELRPMIRSELKQNCVVRDFLSFVFQGEEFHLKDDPASNESASLQDLAMLREFHKVIGKDRGSVKAREILGRNFARILASQPTKNATKPRLHKSVVQDIIKVYLEDARKTDASFFSGTPLTDALEASLDKAVEHPQPIDAKDHFSEDELRLIRAWSELAGQMIGSNPDGWAKHFTDLRLRREDRPGRS